MKNKKQNIIYNIWQPVDRINSRQPCGVHGRKHLSIFPCDKRPALRSDNLLKKEK